MNTGVPRDIIAGKIGCQPVCQIQPLTFTVRATLGDESFEYESKVVETSFHSGAASVLPERRFSTFARMSLLAVYADGEFGMEGFVFPTWV